MAVQSKTLIKDVGSAVLAEVVSQMNRAAGYTSILIGDQLAAGAQQFTLCKFTEDVLVTRVEFGFGGVAANLNNAADEIMLVTGTNPDGTGGTVIGSVDNFGAGAGEFVVTTDLWTTISDLAADSSTATLTGTDAPFQVAAGDALTLRLDMAGALAGAQDLNSVVVTYRPVKDALAIEPAFTPQMSNFRSVAR